MMLPSLIEADALIDDKREAEVLVRHLVLARELHAHGTAGGLRHQRRIIRNRIGAVDAVAAGAARVDHLHLFLRQLPSSSAQLSRWGYTPCVGDQTVALSAFTSATAHEAPTDPCM